MPRLSTVGYMYLRVERKQKPLLRVKLDVCCKPRVGGVSVKTCRTQPKTEDMQRQESC